MTSSRLSTHTLIATVVAAWLTAACNGSGPTATDTDTGTTDTGDTDTGGGTADTGDTDTGGTDTGGGTANTGDTGTGTADTPEKLHVVMEIDRMSGLDALLVDQTINNAFVSLAAIYDEADITLQVVDSNDDLPRIEQITLGDLHGLMTDNRNVTEEGDLAVYALICAGLLGDPDTLGIMFDFAENDANDIPREAFAVFASAHVGFGVRTSAEMLLTTAHELAHCFNLHHNDWEGQGFQNDATIESYCMTDSVRWELSTQSKKHLSTHPSRLVHMGQGSLPFALVTQEHMDQHQTIPFHQYQVVSADDLSNVSRKATFDRSAAIRFVPREASSVSRTAAASGPLKITVSMPKSTYALGEPIAVEVTLTNTGSAPVQVAGLLDPAYGFLNINITKAGGDVVVPFQSPVHANARGAASRTLAAGEEWSKTCKIFFDKGGWVFEQPGTYQIDANYNDIVGKTSIYLESEPTDFTIEASDTASRKQSAELALDYETGLFMYLEGGDHLVKGVANLERIAADYGDTPQAQAARWTLGKAALLPRIDPDTKTRPKARLDRAQHYLKSLLDSDLPAQDVLRVQEMLACGLDDAGRSEEALEVRAQTALKLLGDDTIDLETLKKIDLKPILEQQQIQQLRKAAREQYERIKND